MLLLLLLLCVAVGSVEALGRICEESDERFVNMKTDYFECLEEAGLISSINDGAAWLQRTPTDSEMQQICANEYACQRNLRFWWLQDHPAHEQECVIPNTNLTLSNDIVLATQYFCTMGRRPQSPEEVFNPPKQPKPLEPVDCDKRLMDLVFDDQVIAGGVYCQQKAQVNLRTHLSIFQVNRMKVVSYCQQFAREGLKLTRGSSCRIPQTSFWIDEYFEELSTRMTTSGVPANGRVCTEEDPRLHGLDWEVRNCNRAIRHSSLLYPSDVFPVDSMDAMCRDHSCQLLLRKFVLTPHNYAQECFLPDTSLTFGYDIMLATHFYCVFGRLASAIEEIDTPPKRIPAPDGPPQCNWYVMAMVFGDSTAAVACEAASGVKLKQPDRIPTAQEIQAMKSVPACRSVAQEATEIAKGETCLLPNTQISIEALLKSLADMHNALPTSPPVDPPKYPTCTERDMRFNDLVLKRCHGDSGIQLADLRAVPKDWSKLCRSRACRHQIMEFVTRPGLVERCYLPGTSLVMEDDIIVPIHLHCVGTEPECDPYLMDMVIGSLSYANKCEHESGVKLTPPRRLPTAYDIAHLRGRGDCKSFLGEGMPVANNQTCVFPGSNFSVSAFFEPLKVLESDTSPVMRECDGFKLDQVFGTHDRFVCEEAMGFGSNPLLHVPTPNEMEELCQVTACMTFLNRAYSMVHQDQACWIPGTKLELFSDFIDRMYGFCPRMEDPNPPLDQPSSLKPCDAEIVKMVFDTEDAAQCEFLLDEVVMKPPIKILQNNESELICEVKECRTMMASGLQILIDKPDCLVPNASQPLALRGHFLDRAQQYCQHRPEKPKWSCKPALVEQLQRRGNLEPCQRELEAVLKDYRNGNPYEAGWYCPNKFCAALAQDLTEVFLDQDDCALDGLRLSIWRQVLEPCRPITNFVVTSWFSKVRDGMEDDRCNDAAAIQTERSWDYGQSANCSINTTAATICQNTRCLHWAKDVLNINTCERQKMLEINQQVLDFTKHCYYPNDTQRVFLLGSDGQGDTSMTKPDHFPLVNMFSDTETPAPITLRPQEPDPVSLDDRPTSKPPIHPVIPQPIPPITTPETSGMVTEPPVPSNSPSSASPPPPILPLPSPDFSDSNHIPADHSSSPSSSSWPPPSAVVADWSVYRPNLPSEVASVLIGGTRGPIGPDGSPLITTVLATAIASVSVTASSTGGDSASEATDVLARALSEALHQPVSMEVTREIARAIASTPLGLGSDGTATTLANRITKVLESHGITSPATVVQKIAASISQLLETGTLPEQSGRTIGEEAAIRAGSGSNSAANSNPSELIQAIANELTSQNQTSSARTSIQETTPSPTVPALNAAANGFSVPVVGLCGLLLVLEVLS